MLAIPGIVAQEQATGIPWYETGALCTPASCLENYTFPGAPAPLAPEGSGLPSFYAVVAFQVVLMGLAEAYRGGLTKPPNGFPEPTLYPGGRFDPFKLSEKGDLEKLKLQELKHCRLAMGAFLGCLAQQAYTGVGPVANLSAHVSDPSHVFFGSQASLLPK
jgi:light-harvesting complex I chlorophyll a/b binding protein 1